MEKALLRQWDVEHRQPLAAQKEQGCHKIALPPLDEPVVSLPTFPLGPVGKFCAQSINIDPELDKFFSQPRSVTASNEEDILLRTIQGFEGKESLTHEEEFQRCLVECASLALFEIWQLERGARSSSIEDYGRTTSENQRQRKDLVHRGLKLKELADQFRARLCSKLEDLQQNDPEHFQNYKWEKSNGVYIVDGICLLAGLMWGIFQQINKRSKKGCDVKQLVGCFFDQRPGVLFDERLEPVMETVRKWSVPFANHRRQFEAIVQKLGQYTPIQIDAKDGLASSNQTQAGSISGDTKHYLPTINNHQPMHYSTQIQLGASYQAYEACSSTDDTKHYPPTVNDHQLPTVNDHQLPTVNDHQLPTVNDHQLPTINYLSYQGYEAGSTINNHQPVHYPASIQGANYQAWYPAGAQGRLKIQYSSKAYI
jgi:hypothetical protein